MTAAAAAVVVLCAAVGFTSINRYSGTLRQTDVFSALDPAQRPVDGPGTNVLLVGVDRRGGIDKQTRASLHLGTGNYGPPRTDTVMLVHLSEGDSNATVISLPSASYLAIPAHADAKGVEQPLRKDRLSAAYVLGGPTLLTNTVEQATGVRIDHFVEVDFQGFLTTVDALGGVPVCLDKATKDKLSGLDLPAGTSVVSGTQALSYVRARAIDTEFGRMLRQQKFIASIVQKATSTGTLLNPVSLNAFLDAMTSSVTTDNGFNRDDMLDLGNRLRSIDAASITFFTVPIAKANYRVDIGKLKNQSTVLWGDDAKALFTRLNNDKSLLSDDSDAGEATAVRVAPARLRVKVYNAAGTSGLGRRVADDMAKAGYQVVGQPLNARTSGEPTTVIQYDPDFDRSLRTLQASLPGATTKAVRGLGNTFLVLVGLDYNGLRPVTVSATAAGPATINSPTKPHTAADSICD
jgi:LCP family protein required for cell wall assembly